MILDATAGNRIIWQTKETDTIIHIDIEKQLERKPTLFADNTRTPFKDKQFDTIFYDPPHAWSFNSIFWGFPDKDTFKANHPKDNRQFPPYYGMERYKSKTALVTHLYKAQKEFMRVSDILCFKWNETSHIIDKILPLFKPWVVKYMKKHHSTMKRGKSTTWWVTMIVGNKR